MPKKPKKHGAGKSCWCAPRHITDARGERWLHNDSGPVVFEGQLSDEEAYEEMGRRLLERREELGIGLTEAGRMSGLRPTSLQRYEINGVKTVAKLARILQAYDAGYDELFGDISFAPEP